MKLLGKIFWSDFRKCLAKNVGSFRLSGYYSEYYSNDGDMEDAFYFDIRDKRLIWFIKDKRKKSIKLRVWDCKSIFDAGFKAIRNNDANLDTKTLKEELAVAETDAEELHAYLKFLKENHIIGEPD